jgi:hypothetical protein
METEFKKKPFFVISCVIANSLFTFLVIGALLGFIESKDYLGILFLIFIGWLVYKGWVNIFHLFTYKH